MRKLLLVFLMLAFLLGNASAGQCYVRGSCNIDEFPVFSVSAATNAHAAQSVSEAGYMRICCPRLTFSGNDCSDADAVTILNLSTITNAHVEDPGLGNYTFPVCLTADNTLTCRQADASTPCNTDTGDVGIMSISDGINIVPPLAPMENAHVEQYGIGTYPADICCYVAPEGDVWGVKIETPKNAYYLDVTPTAENLDSTEITITNYSNSAKTAALTIEVLDSTSAVVNALSITVNVEDIPGGGGNKTYTLASLWEITSANTFTVGESYSVVASVEQYINGPFMETVIINNKKKSDLFTVIKQPASVTVPEIPIIAIPLIGIVVLLVLTGKINLPKKKGK